MTKTKPEPRFPRIQMELHVITAPTVEYTWAPARPCTHQYSKGDWVWAWPDSRTLGQVSYIRHNKHKEVISYRVTFPVYDKALFRWHRGRSISYLPQELWPAGFDPIITQTKEPPYP